MNSYDKHRALALRLKAFLDAAMLCFCCRETVTDDEPCSCELVRESVPHGQQLRCLSHDKEAEPALFEAWPD